MNKPLRDGLGGMGGVLAAVGVFIIIYSIFFLGFSTWQKIPEVSAQDLCQVPADVVLVMDTSGSMAEGGNPSQCDWQRLEKVGPSWQCVSHVDYNVDQSWCEAQIDVHCVSPVYAPAQLSKIEAAKSAANSFLDTMGANDQSAIAFFSDTASLAKLLSNDHAATKAAIDGLVPNGATNIGGAIETAIGELGSGRANPQAVKAIILLTDGKANRPNGDGYLENPADVFYAETKASEAAALGYKIFTIGLGLDGEINEAMLQNIANTTGAKYYHATNGDDLSGIYSKIAFEVCQYGSVAGCKYNDLNNNGIIDVGEPKLTNGWEIILGGLATTTQITDQNGCYIFSGLSAGAYTVAEGVNADKLPFTATWPAGGQYLIDLIKGQNITNFDFANYAPACGNGIVDTDNGETCDDGNLANGDGCSATCQIEPGEPTNQNVISGYKYQDDDGLASTTGDRVGLSGWLINLFSSANTSTPLATTTTDGLGYFEFSNLAAGLYSLVENLISGWVQLLAPADINLTGTSTVAANNNFINYLSTPAIGAGDIVINEMMVNSTAVRDEYGEYFEVYNNTDKDIDLKNCVISNLMTGHYTIASTLIVPKNGYAILARNGNPSANGGFTPNYVYGNAILFDNMADELILTCDNVEVDRVEYSKVLGFPDPLNSGASMVLASPSLDNNNGHNWCVSASVFGAGDKGTPGSQNDSCACVPVCGNGAVETGETCDDGQHNGTYGYCNLTCSGPTLAVCGNGVQEGSEACDDGQNNGSVGYCNLTCSGQTPSIDQNIISGYKYQDSDGIATTTNDRTGLSGWLINLFSSANTSTPLATTTTDGLGYFEFSNLAAGLYSLVENLISGWVQLLAPADINLTGTSTVAANNNFINYLRPSEPVCGNGAVETGETCDDGTLNGSVGHCNLTCSGQTPAACGDGVCGGGETCSTCATDCGVCQTGGGGGGGGGPVVLSIFNEQSSNITDHSATITWQTNLYATSRVIYEVKNGDTPCDFNQSWPPNFSFANSTLEDSNIVTGHQMNLAGLLADTTYCYRVISHVSLPDKVGSEYTFHIAGPIAPPPAPIVVTTSTETTNEGVGGGPAPIVTVIPPPTGGVPPGEVAGITITAPEGGQGASTTVEVLPASQVAGAQEQCRPWRWWHILLPLIIYLLLVLVNYLSKIKGKLENWRPGLGWLFAVLLVVLPVVIFWFCSAWVWWVWIIVIIFYFLILIVYLFGSIFENHWPTTILLTLFLIFLLLVIKMCLC